MWSRPLKSWQKWRKNFVCPMKWRGWQTAYHAVAKRCTFELISVMYKNDVIAHGCEITKYGVLQNTMVYIIDIKSAFLSSYMSNWSIKNSTPYYCSIFVHKKRYGPGTSTKRRYKFDTSLKLLVSLSRVMSDVRCTHRWSPQVCLATRIFLREKYGWKTNTANVRIVLHQVFHP